jgi:hypothetical protein
VALFGAGRAGQLRYEISYFSWSIRQSRKLQCCPNLRMSSCEVANSLELS